MDVTFFKNKRIFVTGHTGFKGAWLCKMLTKWGADVTGYSLGVPTDPSLFILSGIENKITSVLGDIRDIYALGTAFAKAQPEIVIHLAAQPLVRESYKNPHETYETNVMGTVNVLECIRKSACVKSFLNVTTDKVYHNNEWEWGYRENETLNGFDPYSNSKSCSELVTDSYKNSFFADGRVSISTARAGNVIGGGDFAADRIIPDCVRAAARGQDIIIRNPHSIRPYQHVLEPLYTYLLIVQRQYEDSALAGCYNVGPDECDCVTTGALAHLFCTHWGEGIQWINQWQDGPHEATFLKLDCSKIKRIFGWQPSWHISDAVEKTVEWTKAYLSGGDLVGVMDRQIDAFLAEAHHSLANR